MNFDWSEYLKLAKELCGQPFVANEEAKLRSSISRVYYAAFSIARNHLRDKEKKVIPKGSEAHKYVQEEFASKANKICKQIGHNLNRLRIERNKADYDDYVANLSSRTKIALEFATSIISGIKRL